MPRPTGVNSTVLSLAMPPEWVAQAEALAPLMSRPGLKVSRGDVLRIALAHGLALVEQQAKIKK